eukprot:2637808-Pleurochrysis_carterae.AAC.1
MLGLATPDALSKNLKPYSRVGYTAPPPRLYSVGRFVSDAQILRDMDGANQWFLTETLGS